MLSEAAMLLDRIGIDADDLRTRLLIARPIVAHAAQLCGAHAGFVSRVKKQHDDFAARAAELPPLAIAIGQIYLWGELADLRPGSWFHPLSLICHRTAVNLNEITAARDLLFCISAVKFASRNFAARR